MKDHSGSMLPDISGYSFRTPRGNDSTHILETLEVGTSANSHSSSKAEKLGHHTSGLAESKKKRLEEWEVSGRRKVATNEHWQVDAIGRTALVGPYTGSPSGACTHRKNESDHVAGLIAPGHEVHGAPSNWVVADDSAKSPTTTSSPTDGVANKWLSPKKPSGKSPVKAQTSPRKLQSTWGLKSAEQKGSVSSNRRTDLTTVSMVSNYMPVPNNSLKTHDHTSKACVGKKFIDKVEARYGDSIKNWDVPDFLREEPNKPNGRLGLHVTQEKRHLQNLHRVQRNKDQEPLMEWARGQWKQQNIGAGGHARRLSVQHQRESTFILG